MSFKKGSLGNFFWALTFVIVNAPPLFLAAEPSFAIEPISLADTDGCRDQIYSASYEFGEPICKYTDSQGNVSYEKPQGQGPFSCAEGYTLLEDGAPLLEINAVAQFLSEMEARRAQCRPKGCRDLGIEPVGSSFFPPPGGEIVTYYVYYTKKICAPPIKPERITVMPRSTEETP